jgi:hypothetical protein
MQASMHEHVAIVQAIQDSDPLYRSPDGAPRGDAYARLVSDAAPCCHGCKPPRQQHQFRREHTRPAPAGSGIHPPNNHSLETNHETTHPAAGSPCTPLYAPRLWLAQTPHPGKPIRYIVPVSAGGGSDMVGRIADRALAACSSSFSSTTRAAAAA